ncbi:MAG: prepilin-type N-terminal cleavage/methylation domain-containing protein [Planctomycetaceae bacterium]|nr:prepilin-type N-terminal cleavage/methylation domain-containing protein [Planctomycetaceae bacterium]
MIQSTHTLWHVQHANRHRAGFTLLEILLAVGLTALLATILFQASQLSHRMATAGMVEQRQLEIANAVQRRLRTDLEKLQRQAPVHGTLDESARQIASNKTVASELRPPQHLTGLWGTVDSMAFLNWGTHRQAESQPVLVAYWHDQAGKLALGDSAALWTVHLQPASRGLKSTRLSLTGQTAANRRELHLPMQTDDEQLLFVPEITQLRFRYYDGTHWTSHWDSTMQQALPQHVEVTMQVLGKADLVRCVIAVSTGRGASFMGGTL